MVSGYAAPGYEPVARVLAEGASVTVGERERRADLGDGGGAFCAYVDGECVVDLWTGPRDRGAWAEDTRAVVMSSTKGLTTLCAHLLEDRGELDLDVPVVRYWPEFGSEGKSSTTVRQLLSHQSGAIGLPGSDELLSWDGRGWDDTVAIAAGVALGGAGLGAGDTPRLPRRHVRVAGRRAGATDQRVQPRHVLRGRGGTAARPRRLHLHRDAGRPRSGRWPPSWSSPCDPGRRVRCAPSIPTSRSGRSVLAGAHGSLFADEEGRPRFAEFMNTPAVLQAEIGALGATATARALARVYAALATGEELVSRASVERFRTEQVCGRDAVMGVPTRWAVGYSLEPPALVPGVPPMHGPNDGAFGHMGAGGQIGFADPSARVACGFVRNHLENQALPLMGACLVDVLYSCTGNGRT